jgi:hypothetical protein
MIEKKQKKISFVLMVLCVLSWFVWVILTDSVFKGFHILYCGGVAAANPSYDCFGAANTYLSHFVGIFASLFIATLFMMNTNVNIFQKWLKFTGVYFLGYFLMMLSFFGEISLYKFTDLWDWSSLGFLPLSIGFFVYGLKTKRMEKFATSEKEEHGTVVDIAYWLLICGCLIIFLSGFISPGFWFYGVIYAGIPIFLYSGSVFLLHHKSMGNKKFSMLIFLSALMLGILFMFWALSDMNIM